MLGLEKYAGAFGAPGRGAHSARLGGLAVVDLLAAAALAFFLGRAGGATGFGYVVAFALVMLAAVAAHEAFGVRTRLNAAIFGRPWTPAPAPTAAPSGSLEPAASH